MSSCLATAGALAPATSSTKLQYKPSLGLDLSKPSNLWDVHSGQTRGKSRESLLPSPKTARVDLHFVPAHTGQSPEPAADRWESKPPVFRIFPVISSSSRVVGCFPIGQGRPGWPGHLRGTSAGKLHPTSPGVMTKTGEIRRVASGVHSNRLSWRLSNCSASASAGESRWRRKQFDFHWPSLCMKS
jgi:hypothetical protein